MLTDLFVENIFFLIFFIENLLFENLLVENLLVENLLVLNSFCLKSGVNTKFLGKELSKFDKILPEKSVLDNFTLLALKDFTKCAKTCDTGL